MDIKQVREEVDQLFNKRSRLMLLWQETAEHFYPERADFTIRREMGDNFADNLMTSYPLLCRRELADQFGSMLRPTSKAWMHMAPTDPQREDNDAKRWLEWAENIQRRAMYDRATKFTRAMKEADNDYSAFGQAVISIRLNKTQDALLYRCHHLRDVVWLEDENGDICLIARKWRPGARQLSTIFGPRNHTSVGALAQKTPFQEVECYHIIMKSEWYDGDLDKIQMGGYSGSYRKEMYPYVSIYFDCTHNHKIECVPTYNREYAIPRWQTVSGSQYAYSPATIVALPEGRLLQSMTYTLLEAGEKITNPPMIAVKDVVKSNVEIFSGGITWVDRDYDERLGESLRPLNQDIGGMPIGIEMQRDTRALLKEAFYLNKLKPFNPGQDPEMTAFQAGQIVQDWIRQAMPIFEPTEQDYNGQVCEMSFELLLRGGAFGAPEQMPRSLRGAEIQFRFESPLHDAIESQKGHKFLEAKQMINEAIALDKSALALLDAKVAMRDALSGIGVPTKWVRNETTVQEIEEAQAAAIEARDVLAAVQAGSEAAKNLGSAQRDLAQAGVA